MARRRRKRGSRYEKVRKLGKIGIYSYYITIPRDYIDELNWRDGQNLTVTLEDEQIVIKDWKRERRTTKEK